MRRTVDRREHPFPFKAILLSRIDIIIPASEDLEDSGMEATLRGEGREDTGRPSDYCRWEDSGFRSPGFL